MLSRELRPPEGIRNGWEPTILRCGKGVELAGRISSSCGSMGRRGSGE
jgi:hypothetical protein